MLEALKESIREETQAAMYPLDNLLSGQWGPLNKAQEQALKTIHSGLKRLAHTAEKTVPAETLKLT